MQYNLIKKTEFDKVRNHNGNWAARMKLFADMCRYNTLVAVKKAGSGHLGSSLSAMDIVTYLYLNELNVLEVGLDSPDRDIYFSSKGHDVPGLYSLFYALGIIPEEKLLMLRRLHGLDGHPEVRQPGIEASTGSLGMGISKAKGMAWAKTYNKNKGNVYVLTGDGEFQEGQIWESLQATAHQKVNNVTAIMDHNKYQTDMLVADVNNIEDVVKKVSAFGWYVVRINGHDFNELRKTFDALKKVTDKPKMIIADTIKGRGVSFMEKPLTETFQGKTLYKWHSGAPDDESYVKGLNELTESINKLADEIGLGKINIPENKAEGKVVTKLDKEFVTDAYGEALVELAKTNKKFVVLDGDLSADCKLRNFERTYPDRFIENGIAEQDMVSMAGGLARMGLIPIVNTFASFLAARANEQIYNNAGERTKIIYTCHFAGMIPAGPGKSHQSVRDISLFGALPNVTIIQPCNAQETKWATDYCINVAEENCVLRLIIGPSPERIQLPDDYKFKVGVGAALTEGNDAILFGYGPVMLHEALVAADYLKKIGFGLKVVNMPWLNKIDSEWLKEIVKNQKRIFVLEDHSAIGGLGDRILNALVKIREISGLEFTNLGLTEYPECGTPLEVLEYHQLDGKSLAQRISGIKDIETAEAVNQKYTAIQLQAG
ncbi:MAG: 1-deoxy-D-xylulose-5-phosphate synthase [Ignavibacterium album]|uniref:transketolase C-terminal domain-containing protein n=1 Tax=Ignavibacterium album TaxID=591197 RepID=UPI0026EA9E63|nr:transketolase C-terminal domain-containing protein [Ignavibacterium album]MBI5662991.1 1-deoxy-D-xylulose-5-phosphate synthase [Ignavibacterium album]